MIRRWALGIFLVIVILTIIYWEVINYGLAQARGQIAIIQGAVPVEEVLADPSFPDSLKTKILLIDAVRSYAIDSLGLTNSQNYTTFYDQQGKTSLWNLSACEPYSLTPKTWSFPFLGSFPYKGFFDLEKAKEERNELKSEGYDTRIRPVGGWSTLGWFSDPILSNMLLRSEGKLANLIIHELTHSTLFVKDDIEFNENLASFIGDQGAHLFLEATYGKGSAELEDYILGQEDSNQLINHMIYATGLLDQLYQSFPENQSDSIKEIHKHILIDEIASSVDTLHFHNNRYYKLFSQANPNNAYFMSFMRYHSSEDSLQFLLNSDYNGNLKMFIDGMRKFHGKD